MDDLSNIFEEAENYLTVSLSKWKKHLPDLYEDAFQEGMIQVWRDVEAGVDGGATTKLKILRRASQKANNFFHRNGEYYFGKPRKSRDGIRSRTETIEKVKVYLDETKGLRDNVWPMPKEVSDALGIHHSTAQKILRDIKEGRIDHMVYRDDGRKDWNHYSTVSVETLASSNSADQEVRSWMDNLPKEAVSWEDDFVAHTDMVENIKKLAPQYQEILYLRFYEGWTPTEIARYCGLDKYPSAEGGRRVQDAVSQLRAVVHPYEGECSAGHERTELNTKVSKRKDGIWVRSCLTCRKENIVETNKKMKANGTKPGRKEKLRCPQNHLKDTRDSHGRLRCKECRRLAQLAYTARQKAKKEAGG